MKTMLLMPEQPEKIDKQIAASVPGRFARNWSLPKFGRPHFKWTPMASAALVLILICAVGTAYVGVKLVAMADAYKVQFNTK
jgi:hypothetical protein